MRKPKNAHYVSMLSALLIASGLLCGAAAPYTDINLRGAPEHEVRFTSGRTIYVEALVGDQWMSCYRSAGGRIDLPNMRYAAPAFELQIKDDPKATAAEPLSKDWQWKSASEAPMTERGARHFVVELSNSARPIDVKVHTLLDGTPVLVRWLEITNTGMRPIALRACYPWSGMLWSSKGWNPSDDMFPAVMNTYSLGYQTKSDTGYEGWFDWKRLPPGKTVVESVKGNGQDDPFFIIRQDLKGEYFIGDLAWSANWRMEFAFEEDKSKAFSGVSFKMGPMAKDALRVIAPGETVRTPAVHLGHIEGDLDGAVQAMHDHIRRSVLPTLAPSVRSHLIQYAIPGDQGFFTGDAFNETNIMKSIDVAAAIGSELFILDAGWYDVYGEWVPSPRKFPHGLGPLVEYAHNKGLLFGLYSEAEGGRGDWSRCRMAKEHPDWLGPQNILDLGRPEVAAYMESEIDGLISRYKPELYRHDYIVVPNTFEGPSTLREGFMENNYWRYYDSFDRVFEQVRAKYPDVIVQMCSNGGAREDLNMMGQVHETYTNEGEPQRVLPSYSGKTLSLPPETLVMGLGNYRDRGHLDTHLRCMYTLSTPWMLGGVATSVEELSPEHRDRYLHYANIYKKFIRPILPTCKVYHHAPVSSHGGVTSSPWFVMEFASANRAKGWATIVRTDEGDSDTYLFKPKGLDPGKTYRVIFDSLGTTVDVSGLQLVREGLPVRLEAVMSSELLLFESRK